MPILNKLAQLSVKAIPAVVTPKAHAVLNYANVAVFLATAGLFWRRNKRAAVGALIGGGAALAVNLLTDYPGGVKKVIPYRRRRDIDFGLAALSATLPEFLAFDHDQERRFFVAEGTVMSAITELTQFPGQGRRAGRVRLAA